MGRGDPGPRKERTDNRIKKIIPIDLPGISAHFNTAIGNIKGQVKLAKEMSANKKEEKAGHIWRSLVVFLVSALDYYMHGLTGYGLCQMYNYNDDWSGWKESKPYKDLHLNVTMQFLKEVADIGGDEWLLDLVSYNYETRSLVSFKSMKRQLDLLGIDIKLVASEAFPSFIGKGNTEDRFQPCLDQMEKRIGELCHDRNVIAHQANRTYDTRAIREVTEEEVEGYISDVEKIVGAINTLANRKE